MRRKDEGKGNVKGIRYVMSFQKQEERRAFRSVVETCSAHIRKSEGNVKGNVKGNVNAMFRKRSVKMMSIQMQVMDICMRDD